MGTHPIFESDFDCLTDFQMNRVAPISRLSRRCLRYETTKTHKSTNATRKFMLNQLFGQGKLSEQQYFAAQYRMACLRATGAWFIWSMWIYNEKWDAVSFLVKSGKPPMM